MVVKFKLPCYPPFSQFSSMVTALMMGGQMRPEMSFIYPANILHSHYKMYVFYLYIPWQIAVRWSRQSENFRFSLTRLQTGLYKLNTMWRDLFLICALYSLTLSVCKVIWDVYFRAMTPVLTLPVFLWLCLVLELFCTDGKVTNGSHSQGIRSRVIRT